MPAFGDSSVTGGSHGVFWGLNQSHVYIYMVTLYLTLAILVMTLYLVLMVTLYLVPTLYL